MSHVERFESRTLLSHGDNGITAVTAEVINGTLTIRGTASDDYVTLTESSKIKKSAGRVVSDDYVLSVGRDHPTLTYFPKSQVTAIDIATGDGNDRVNLASRDKMFRKYGRSHGKLVNAIHQVPTTIHGDAGNDNLSGNGGVDSIDGGTGYDYILGGGGDDLLVGGDGNDVLIAYAGNATLQGGAGNDLFFRETLPRSMANIGTVVVDGGDGDDTYASIRDPDPMLTSVESKLGNAGFKLTADGYVVVEATQTKPRKR